MNNLTAFASSLTVPSKSMQQIISSFDPLPAEALLLGVASDGLPVLLNLHDPVPGPILIAGDSGSGKTALLKMIALAGCLKHTSTDLLFGAVTERPSEWSMFESFPHAVGIFPTSQVASIDFIQSLYEWAHQTTSPRQSILLLVDGLKSVQGLDDMTLMQLRWLLLRGPSRRIWPIITLNSLEVSSVHAWLPAFKTRIFGRIQNAATAQMLDAGTAELSELQSGNQFTLREGLDHWCRFWIPS